MYHRDLLFTDESIRDGYNKWNTYSSILEHSFPTQNKPAITITLSSSHQASITQRSPIHSAAACLPASRLTLHQHLCQQCSTPPPHIGSSTRLHFLAGAIRYAQSQVLARLPLLTQCLTHGRLFSLPTSTPLPPLSSPPAFYSINCPCNFEGESG